MTPAAHICELCDNAGTLRDGNACPHCSLSRWMDLKGTEVVRVKRTVWVRANGYDTYHGVVSARAVRPE